MPHKDELLYVASQQAARDVRHRLPPAAARAVPGRRRIGIATIKAQLANMRDGGFISAHDFHIASRIADVVCGGDVERGSLVNEEYLMALERKHFVALRRPTQDPGTDHGHAADRQAGAQLRQPRPLKPRSASFAPIRQENDHDQTNPRRLHRRRHAHAHRQGAARLLPQHPARRPARAAMRAALAQVPGLDPAAIEDAIVGCAFPEAEQGMNMARVGAVLAGLPHRSAASPSTASAPRA